MSKNGVVARVRVKVSSTSSFAAKIAHQPPNLRSLPKFPKFTRLLLFLVYTILQPLEFPNRPVTHLIDEQHMPASSVKLDQVSRSKWTALPTKD